MKSFEEGVKKTSRRSCDEVSKRFFNIQQNKTHLRKEG